MGTEDTGDQSRRGLLLGAATVALLGLGWFVLSHVVMGTATVDALVEALGVVLALLVVASVIGAVRASLVANRDELDDVTPDRLRGGSDR
ncbi:MAG TPA: hypothetical protein VH561_12775 [Micromonosporaceae bacterium]